MPACSQGLFLSYMGGLVFGSGNDLIFGWQLPQPLLHWRIEHHHTQYLLSRKKKVCYFVGGNDVWYTYVCILPYKPWHTYDCIFTVRHILKTTAPPPPLGSMQVPPGLQHMRLARHCVWSPEITGSHSSVSDHEITVIYSIFSTWIWLKMQSPQVERLAIGWHYGTEPGYMDNLKRWSLKSFYESTPSIFQRRVFKSIPLATCKMRMFQNDIEVAPQIWHFILWNALLFKNPPNLETEP